MSQKMGHSFEYSTKAVAESQSFNYWNEVVLKHCLLADSNLLDDSPFNGKLQFSKFGLLDICTFDSSDHIWFRNANHVRQSPHDDMWLGFFQKGHGQIEQEGRKADIHRGDLVLYDSAKAFKFSFGGNSNHLVRIPRSLLNKTLPNVGRLTAQVINPNRPGVVPLREMLLQATEGLGGVNDSGLEDRFSQSIVDLLTLSLEIPDIKQTGVESDLYCRAMNYIQAHLSDPDLNLEKLAKIHHVSVRTMIRAFNRHQKTPVSTIWQERLKASRNAIERGNGKTVSEIAFEYGFNDFSHFSRAFRKAFSISPSELLKQNS
ncbi:helix-turn-helix domain-containing protein [Vibrio natriegens]|uniref:helix-turn-helix domain-containing protein n=1 Tax=Vibrio natriegens TaxID=691 RepID=UPI002283B305|nr:helix-turn-helix domain-containing protein [Vibrio natriegens]MCY9876928.1 helix-turn-helix domain-containing protein [Vibrio natriegens]